MQTYGDFQSGPKHIYSELSPTVSLPEKYAQVKAYFLG